jgi:hypothetical protein
MSRHGGSAGQFPARTDEVTGVAIGIALQVVLVLGFRLPEFTSGSDFRYNPARPKARSVDVGDRVLCEATLLIVGVEDRRAVAHAYIVTLTIAGRRVMYLEKEFQEISETGLVGIEYDLDRFGVRAVIPIGGVLDVATRIAHPGGHYARQPPDELLHAPKTAASQNRTFSSPSHRYVSSLENNLT